MLIHHIDLEVPLSFTVDDVLSPEECEHLIARIEAASPQAAPVSLPGGPVMRPDIRNNTRVMFDDEAIAALLFERVRHRLPPRMKRRVVSGANARLRCYRYAVGQRFAPHYDGAYQPSSEERTELTFLIYLNEGFVGGETALLDLGETIVPKRGRALFFQHAILHEGCPVTSGTKYALRSDILYREEGTAS